MKRMYISAVVLFICAGMVSQAFAGSTSTFSISPPTIATPVFDSKETDIKVGGTYLSMKSSGTASASSEFTITGYGVNFAGRSAFGNMVAIDYAVGILAMNGDLGKDTGMKLKGVNVPISFNLEIQPYRNDVFNIILFAGPAFNFSMMQVTNVPTVIGFTVVNEYLDITSSLYGAQGGVQMGLLLGPIHVDVFGMATNLRGTQSIDHSLGGTESYDIPAYTTASFGLDLMYVPWGLTLSSLMQEAEQSDNNGTKTTLYTLSWSHRF